jgi:kanamycin nucleotidyltransferase
MSRENRMALVRDIVDRILASRQDAIAIGLYGSMARGTDAPCSDVEMMCILDSQNEDYSREWSYGPGKAEVNFYSENIAVALAAEIDGDWPLTHGAFCNVLALHDPTGFFPRLRDVVLSQPDERFTETIRDVIVGEIYEAVGKLRNARHTGHTAYLPRLAIDLAMYGAFLIGLANRRLYTTGATVLEESLTLDAQPAGYRALCELAMTGNLSQPNPIFHVCEAFWAGVEQWARERGVCIEHPRLPF